MLPSNNCSKHIYEKLALLNMCQIYIWLNIDYTNIACMKDIAIWHPVVHGGYS